MAQLIDSEYGGTALIADPIHQYIQFTVPEKKGEVTEKALIDSPWVQRLRYIYQLQSARWVYPSAEHSRFQHSLGAMHTGRRVRQASLSVAAQSARRRVPVGAVYRTVHARGWPVARYRPRPLRPFL